MSGIYIHGMSMPTEAGVIVIYKRSGKFYAGNGMCPIEPVPDHGRLGDLDALATMYDPDTDFGMSVRDMIADSPTIIPADHTPRQDDPRPIDGHQEIRWTLDVQTGVLTTGLADAVTKE